MSIKVIKEICIWAEYGWSDGDTDVSGAHIRSKGRFLFIDPSTVLDFKSYPDWNFDGSSTKQAVTKQSDVIIRPVKVIIDPIRNRPQQMSVLVWCDCWNMDDTPHKTNHRQKLKDVLQERVEWMNKQAPMFGIEQEYQLHYYNSDDKPLLPDSRPQGPYYCGYGSSQTRGRRVADEHAKRCMNSGLILWGINAEVAPSQWEFQTRPHDPVETGDELWLIRWILIRTAEDVEMDVSFHPKALGPLWNGSGAHINFSMDEIRTEEYAYIRIIERIRKYHIHTPAWEFYGSGNELRLTGMYETSSIDEFRFGTADRSASIRIPPDTAKAHKGYLEDRRPAANIDPYLAVGWLICALSS